MDFQLQLALNNLYAESLLQNSALILAERAVSNSHRVGLTNLTFDQPKLVDGNCFYRAVIQQMWRPEMQQHF